MTTSPPTETTLMLQRGIAAARSGRSDDARQILEQVIEADPSNEMAWLWLSGLMTTNQQKRACLERVLEANPENVYARAGLARLHDGPHMGQDELEARLASVTSGHGSETSGAGSIHETELADYSERRRLKAPPPSNGRAKNRKRESGKSYTQLPLSAGHNGTVLEVNTASSSEPAELSCPACDEPISSKAKMCPYCFMPFKSLDELLGRVGQAPSGHSSSSRPKRRGILGHLGL